MPKETASPKGAEAEIGHGSIPFLPPRYGGGDGPTPLGAFQAIPVGDPSYVANPEPTKERAATVTVYGLVRMYYMLLFGYTAVSISIDGGKAWLDYSQNQQVISLIKQGGGHIMNRHATVTGTLRLQDLGYGPALVIAVDDLLPDLRKKT